MKIFLLHFPIIINVTPYQLSMQDELIQAIQECQNGEKKELPQMIREFHELLI